MHRMNRRGMTLIELLMAFAILMGGIVCIFALLLAGTSSHRRAMKETEATMIAGSVLADLRGEFARSNLPRSDGNEYRELDEYPGYKVNRLIYSVEPPRQGGALADAREYFVRVRVRWSEKGENQAVEFKTVMYRGSNIGPRVP